MENYFRKLKSDEKARIKRAVELYLSGLVNPEFVFANAKGRMVVNVDFVATFLMSPALLELQAKKRGISNHIFSKRVFDLVEAEKTLEYEVPWRLH